MAPLGNNTAVVDGAPAVPPNTPAHAPQDQHHPQQRSGAPLPQALDALPMLPPSPLPSNSSRALVPIFTDRVSSLPLVACTLQAYGQARSTGDALSLALLCTEVAVGLATLPTRAVVSPLPLLCPLPLRLVDSMLCLWLDCVQKVAPCIKGPPRKMCRPIRICYRKSRGKVAEVTTGAKVAVGNLLSTACGRRLLSCSGGLLMSADHCVSSVLPSPDTTQVCNLTRTITALVRVPMSSAKLIHQALNDIQKQSETLP